MIPPTHLISSFLKIFHHPPTLISYAPGRVNLLGGHTDYNDGWVLPVAIDRYAWLAARPTSSDEVRIHALDLGETVSINIHQLDDKLDTQSQPLPKWAHYPAGVAWSLQRHGLSLAGFDAVLTSTVPIEAGLSSSAAIEVVFAVTWESITGWQIDRMSLAQLCQSAENLYVGVNSGLMDQFASLHGIAGNAIFFDCRTLEWESVPLSEKTALIIADTNVRRSLGDSAYNERRAACAEAVRILSEHLLNITALRDVKVQEFESHQHLLPPIIRRRAEHVVRECARTLRGIEKLKADDISKQENKYMAYMDFFDLTELMDIKPSPGSIFIHSLTEPFNEEMEIDFERMQNWLDKFNIPLKKAHAGGHANGPQLKDIADAISPKQLFPIHTEKAGMFKDIVEGNVTIPELGRNYEL